MFDQTFKHLLPSTMGILSLTLLSCIPDTLSPADPDAYIKSKPIEIIEVVEVESELRPGEVYFSERQESATISGTAKDYNGTILPSVKVAHFDSGIETRADASGKFSLKIPKNQLGDVGKVWMFFLKNLSESNGQGSTVLKQVVLGEEVYYLVRDEYCR